MDSDKEAALATIIIATFTENIKRKKGERESGGLNLGFRGEIPMDSILSYFVSYVWRKWKFTKIILVWHRGTLRNYQDISKTIF